MRVTCLIPTFKNGAMLRASMESALAQTVTDLELFVVCDGAPPITHTIADEFAARDKRVTVFKFEKGPRHGETWRHEALQHATGDVVCYLSDDDYWFPDHLETLTSLLADSDFAHTRYTAIMPTFEFAANPQTITQAETRQRMCAENFNFFGLSVAGHRLSGYRRLPEGWSPAPIDIGTDLHMWRKWLRADGMRFAASSAVTSLSIARYPRGEQDPATALHEADFWRAAMRDPATRQALRDLIPADQSPLPSARVAVRACELDRTRREEVASAVAELDRVHASRLWRYSAPARHIWRRVRDAFKLDG